MEPSELPALTFVQCLPRSWWLMQPPEALGPAGSQNGSWRGKTGRMEERKGSPGEDAQCQAGSLLPR